MFRVVSKRILPALTLAALCAAVLAIASAENIDPQSDNSQFAWGENVGWINAEPSGNGGAGMQVSGLKITGYMYGENIGWINLHCENNVTCGAVPYGVTNDNLGNLGGYAWGENVGWISFCDQDVPGTCNVGGASTYRVIIDPNTGIFSGYAWGENIGWISFSDITPVAYKVQFTDGDTIPGASDNCDFDANENQLNADLLFSAYAVPWILDGVSPEGLSLGGNVCDPNDDNNGCSDVREATLVPPRDPVNPYDFADMWVPALPASGPATGGRSATITLADALAGLTWVGRANNGAAGTDGRDYDSDVNANAVEDGAEYDRTPGVGPGLSGPPNGAVTLQDILVIIDQVGDVC